MTLGQTLGVALLGLSGSVVTVEVDIADGIPLYCPLGLPDAAMNESRDRVRAALVNCGESWPNRKVTVSLSPAWLPKSGSSFDLSIALANLIAQEPFRQTLVLGEFAPNGRIRAVRGVLPSLIAAHCAWTTRAIVPATNLGEESLMSQMEIISFASLTDVLRWLRTWEREIADTLDLIVEDDSVDLDFADVASQVRARFAAEVAAAGGHHLLLIGPRGAGKTMIASRLPTILPALTMDQAPEVTAIHSIAGGVSTRSPMTRIAPIVAPHTPHSKP
jgi:magnesium chelatase family protein